VSCYLYEYFCLKRGTTIRVGGRSLTVFDSEKQILSCLKLDMPVVHHRQIPLESTSEYFLKQYSLSGLSNGGVVCLL
jgi:hypothetical protein